MAIGWAGAQSALSPAPVNRPRATTRHPGSKSPVYARKARRKRRERSK